MDGHQRGALQHPKAVRAVDARDVLRRHREDQVDIAGQERRHPGRIAGDRAELDPGQVVAGLAPPALVRLEHGEAVDVALDHLERAGAVGVQVGIVARVAVGGRDGGIMGLGPRLRHDEDQRQALQQHRIGRRGDQLHRVVVDLAHRRQLGHVGLHGRALVRRALEREHHVVGGERRAVVERHALAQGKAPGGGIDRGPGCREPRLQDEIGVAQHQALVDVALHGIGQGLVVAMRVEPQDVAGGGVAEGFRIGAGRGTQQQDQPDRQQPRLHAHLPLSPNSAASFRRQAQDSATHAQAMPGSYPQRCPSRKYAAIIAPKHRRDNPHLTCGAS